MTAPHNQVKDHDLPGSWSHDFARPKQFIHLEEDYSGHFSKPEFEPI
jgi:hypothetical protein